MSESDAAVDRLLTSLRERAKELDCLFEVEQALSTSDSDLEAAFQAVVDAIPSGWQYPEVCQARLVHGGREYRSADFEPTPWALTVPIVVQEHVLGEVSVYYLEERPREALGPFLAEEERLLKTVAERLAHAILYCQLKDMRQRWERAGQADSSGRERGWRGPIDLLRRSDPDLYLRIARKTINHLAWIGVDDAQTVLQEIYGRSDPSATPAQAEINVPGRQRRLDLTALLEGTPFELAARHLGNEEILNLVEQWIVQDKASFLPKVLMEPTSSISEIGDALRRFVHVMAASGQLTPSALDELRAGLSRRFLTDQLELVGVARRYVEPADFIALLDRVAGPAKSVGRLGGKTAGLFLAERILRRADAAGGGIGAFKVPRSWYIASDGLIRFITHNELEEVLEEKYKETSQVRQEYPNLVQLFKSCEHPPEIVKGVSLALEELGDVPLIVRSSSLLEDRLGSAFSGKYKSLFLANQGTKDERLAALLDAIAEVYASVLGPDPIEYRRERGLLDFDEGMAILIQEVVGQRVGDHFLPALAGVAFSNNELSWSPRIRREDGLIRIVPGLGTRAVDRIGDDYPILCAPGQPGLRVNTSVDEAVRYSPRKADAINLVSRTFETVELKELVRNHGAAYPGFDKVFSVLRDGALTRPVSKLIDPARDELVASFEGLLGASPFVGQIRSMLKALQDALGTPVDIEFAHDGRDLYLLQCRPQGYAETEAPAAIPAELPAEDVVFVARRYVSNGWLPDVTHVVYVSPEGYAALESMAELQLVGRVISQLNKLLPKRQFILMGPGRWGSRGDIRLGVSVTYSDINNTSLLVEVARRTGQYRPELSFGTHFFQDLVEASIRYLPLYPDEDSELNEGFLLQAPNLLGSLLPEMERFADVVRVVDVPAVTGGRVLRVLMNADLGQAVGILVAVGDHRSVAAAEPAARRPRQPEEPSRWRLQMAERVAAATDPTRFGVVAMYLVGSTKNATAGPSADIDLLVHFRGDDAQRADLLSWLEGWSQCLAEINYLRTGHRQEALLDVHIVTDEDVAKRVGVAVKIGAVTDPARELPLRAAPSAAAPAGR